MLTESLIVATNIRKPDVHEGEAYREHVCGTMRNLIDAGLCSYFFKMNYSQYKLNCIRTTELMGLHANWNVHGIQVFTTSALVGTQYKV